MKQVEPLAITSGRRNWVLEEFQKLLEEWRAWEVHVALIQDQPYNLNTHSEVFADGEENMRRHTILQAKTLTFLNNNFAGHGFLSGFDGTHIDRTDLRLKVRVKHRLLELDVLHASFPYAKLPEAFWKQQGKELVERPSRKTGDAAVDVAASYLKNPLSSGG